MAVSTKSVVVLVIQDPQNSQEQVEDIQIERDGSRNLFLNMIVPHNQLRINENIARENQRRSTTIDKLHSAISREERSNEPKQDQEPQPTERYGIQFVKSYFDWHANAVKATKIPRVNTSASTTMRDS